jgi:hypothetical protein
MYVACDCADPFRTTAMVKRKPLLQGVTLRQLSGPRTLILSIAL